MKRTSSPSHRHGPTHEDAWRVIRRLAPHLHIAHQIAGRIRVKLDGAAVDDETMRAVGLERLRAAAKGLRGVQEIQFNALARSCVVEYDNRVIPDAAWPDLLGERDSPAAAALIALMLERYDEIGDA